MRAWTTPRREFLLVGALAVAAQLELWLAPAASADRRILAPLALLLAGSLLWRTRSPLLVLALNLGGWILIDAVIVDRVGTESGDPVVLGAVLGVAIYSVGAHTGPGIPAAGGIALVAAMVVLGTVSEAQSDLGDVLFFTVVFGGVWLAGRAIRQRRQRERELIVQRDEGARAAVAEERARIARELHDVVAHAISVIVLQARGARHAEGTERDAAISAIESTGAAALAEMRRLLHVLRADDDEVALGPQPSLAQLAPLVSQIRAAGLPVELRVEGTPRELPPGVDVSAYRIVQEALTNALKHAGPAHARVSVRYEQDAVELEITDTGSGAGNGSGAGHGLLGMRERVAVFGGQLDSGPDRGGGFRVRARLPL